MSQSENKNRLVIGIGGGTASGKSTLSENIKNYLGSEITLISLDSFYKGLNDKEKEDAENYNFDHPNSLDLDLAYEAIKEICAGNDYEIPIYDFALHKRSQ